MFFLEHFGLGTGSFAFSVGVGVGLEIFVDGAGFPAVFHQNARKNFQFRKVRVEMQPASDGFGLSSFQTFFGKRESQTLSRSFPSSERSDVIGWLR